MLASGHLAGSLQSADTCCPGLAAVRRPDRLDRCLRMPRRSNQHVCMLPRRQTPALTLEDRCIAACATRLSFLSRLGSLFGSHGFAMLPLQPPPDENETDDGQDDSADTDRDDKIRIVVDPAVGDPPGVRVSPL